MAKGNQITRDVTGSIELSEVQFEAQYLRPDGTKPGFQVMRSVATNKSRTDPQEWQNGWSIRLFPTYVRLTHPDAWDHYIPLTQVKIMLGK